MGDILNASIGQFQLVGLGGDHCLIGFNGGLPVHGKRSGVGRRRQWSRVDSKCLVLVFQVEVCLEFTCVDNRAVGAVAAIVLLFQVPPPLFDGIDFPVPNPIIQLGQPWRCLWYVHRHPAERSFDHQALKIPGASFHTAATHCATGNGQSVVGAALTVAFPNLIAVEHQLWASGNGTAWAFARAFVAAFAK